MPASNTASFMGTTALVSRTVFRLRPIFAAAVAGVFAAGSSFAEEISFSGKAEASISERIKGVSGKSESSSLVFPGATLPLQVLADLTSSDNQFPSAGAVAAQFADPTQLNQDNPEEFAINLTLNSVSPEVQYEGVAIAQEIREVVFSAEELGGGLTDGETVELTGRFFVDGALTIIAADSSRDLTGSNVKLTVSVVAAPEGQTSEAALLGEVALVGDTDGGVTVNVDGNFPTSRLVLSNLASLNTEFGVFHVLVIPSIQIDYSYTAIVGTPMTLTASVRVDAANIPDNVGVAAVLGTPASTLTQVIGITNGESAATKTVDLIQRERDDPNGELVFPTALGGLFGNCGLFGLEFAAGLLAMGGMKARRFGFSRRIN